MEFLSEAENPSFVDSFGCSPDHTAWPSNASPSSLRSEWPRDPQELMIIRPANSGPSWSLPVKSPFGLLLVSITFGTRKKAEKGAAWTRSCVSDHAFSCVSEMAPVNGTGWAHIVPLFFCLSRKTACHKLLYNHCCAVPGRFLTKERQIPCRDQWHDYLFPEKGKEKKIYELILQSNF